MLRSFAGRLTALVLAMTAPLWVILLLKWPISSDLVFYATSLKSFSMQFWASEMYPRWLMDTNDGMGSPVFLFYSPLSFYFMSVFQFIAPIDPHGFGRIFIGITLALLTGGITCYRWLRLTLSREQAENGALLYAAFPYLALHIYGGFAVAQLWGIALFPFLLESTHNVTQKGVRAFPKLAIAYAALFMTHLPSLLVFGGVPILYVLAFSPREHRWLYVSVAVFAVFLGGCMAANYLAPALLNRPFIATEHFLDGNLVYSQDFLDTYSLLGIITILLPLAVFYIEMPKAVRHEALTPAIRFWLAVLALLLFMALPLSKPLWDHITPLQHLQFPFRFLLAMLPAAVFIAVQWIPRAKSQKMYHMLFIIGLTSAAAFSSETSFFAKESPVAAILKNNLLARPEYQTQWMREQGKDFHLRLPDKFKNLPPVSFARGKGKANLMSQGGRSLELHVTVDSPDATLLVKRFYFPGWKASPGTVSVGEQDALVSVHVPHGTFDIKLTQPWFAGEREGMVISLFAWMVLMMWLGLSGLRMQPNRPITGGSPTL